MILPALSIKQPYADLIRKGEKSIETRMWRTGYRGPLVICSSRLPVGQGPVGKALCIVFLRHCRPMEMIDQGAACCTIYAGAKSWIFHERWVDLNWFEVRGQRGIFPLIVPEGKFFCPEDRALAFAWLDWAKEKGFIDKIKKGTADERG